MYKSVFTPDNAAVLLIDHEYGAMAFTHSHDVNLVSENTFKLARIAKALSMPAVLTVKATGRKKLFVAGLTTEICVAFPVLQMLDEGYEVQVSADASASRTKYGDDIALRRMESAGAIVTTVDQIIAELAIDWTSPNGQKLMPILNY